MGVRDLSHDDFSMAMSKGKITREEIVNAVAQMLEKKDYALALWEMGAASWGRVDRWSDIDMMLVVEDDAVEESFQVIETALETLGGIEKKFRIPEPSWHGHSQCFYRLNRASPFHMLDIAIVKKSSDKDRFKQFSIHGEPTVHFDKGDFTLDEGLDIEEHVRKVMGRLESLSNTFEMFKVLTLKEVRRDNPVEAFSYYYGMTFRPLVEVLRMKYCPVRFNFGTRYVHYVFPKEVADKLVKFTYVKDMNQLEERLEEAHEWFREVAESIDEGEVRKKVAEESEKYEVEE